jgi:hypothetical protein
VSEAEDDDDTTNQQVSHLVRPKATATITTTTIKENTPNRQTRQSISGSCEKEANDEHNQSLLTTSGTMHITTPKTAASNAHFIFGLSDDELGDDSHLSNCKTAQEHSDEIRSQNNQNPKSNETINEFLASSTSSTADNTNDSAPMDDACGYSNPLKSDDNSMRDTIATTRDTFDLDDFVINEHHKADQQNQSAIDLKTNCLPSTTTPVSDNASRLCTNEKATSLLSDAIPKGSKKKTGNLLQNINWSNLGQISSQFYEWCAGTEGLSWGC